DNSLFSDVFGGQPKYATTSNARSSASNRSMASDLDYDSIFTPSASSEYHNVGNSDKSSLPVYDKPVYDEDIFDGLPGLKSKSAAPTVRFDEDVFVSASVPQPATNRDSGDDFDDLLGNFTRTEKVKEENVSSNAKINSSSKGFDDLLPGFGSGRSPAKNRAIPESRWDSVPTVGSKQKSVVDDPFVVLETSSPPHSSSRVTVDPLEEISKLGKSSSLKTEVASSKGGAFDDLDPLSTLGKSRHSSMKDNHGSVSSSSAVPRSTAVQEPTPSSLHSYESESKFDTNPASNSGGGQFEEIWLTVSEIPLFTQPTAAPPPSRSPPPIPRKASKSERSKGADFSQHAQSPKTASTVNRGAAFSQFDEFDGFPMGGRSQSNFDESFYGSETNMHSAAAASAAAMKDAMDKAEAKFRQAKEVRERENAKAARNKESGSLEKDEHDEQEKELRERSEREKKQREEEARERKRLESERLKEAEREKARQAVERATREARERAATEARLKAERAAVEKANAEARERAERVAVQRAQAEARERAAAEAKERAAEAREKEEREKAIRSDAEARRRAERAAVDRATAEARERAAAEARDRAEAREKAAAAARMSQQNNENDLESFFSGGRASSAPRARTSSVDPLFEQQFQSKAAPENAKRPSPPAYGGTSSNLKKAASTTNFVDDLSSIFGAGAPSGDFQEVEGETEERRRARIERHQRTQQRAAKALAEKNQRDLQVQREQEERHRIAEVLDTEIKRWAAGKEGNLRALLSTLQYVLWPECGWQPVSLTDLITGVSVKKVYRKATLCIHPDKVQQKGATLQQKYIAEKVFDLLKEAWNKFNSEELF
ncbi:hypothetical protein M569_09873, partial [Genlisea aurea]